MSLGHYCSDLMMVHIKDPSRDPPMQQEGGTVLPVVPDKCIHLHPAACAVYSFAFRCGLIAILGAQCHNLLVMAPANDPVVADVGHSIEDCRRSA